MMSDMNLPITFRNMTLNDIDQVVEIENQSFTTPWSREAFIGELRDNHFAKYVLALKNDIIVGYAGMWVIIDEAHVTNIAISPSYRRMKIGEALLRYLMATAVVNGADRITLEVRVSNESAKCLYQKLGFKEYGIRKGYYSDNNEDACIMWATLQE